MSAAEIGVPLFACLVGVAWLSDAILLQPTGLGPSDVGADIFELAARSLSMFLFFAIPLMILYISVFCLLRWPNILSAAGAWFVWGTFISIAVMNEQSTWDGKVVARFELGIALAVVAIAIRHTVGSSPVLDPFVVAQRAPRICLTVWMGSALVAGISVWWKAKHGDLFGATVLVVVLLVGVGGPITVVRRAVAGPSFNALRKIAKAVEDDLLFVVSVVPLIALGAPEFAKAVKLSVVWVVLFAMVCSLLVREVLLRLKVSVGLAGFFRGVRAVCLLAALGSVVFQLMLGYAGNRLIAAGAPPMVLDISDEPTPFDESTELKEDNTSVLEGFGTSLVDLLMRSSGGLYRPVVKISTDTRATCYVLLGNKNGSYVLWRMGRNQRIEWLSSDSAGLASASFKRMFDSFRHWVPLRNLAKYWNFNTCRLR